MAKLRQQRKMVKKLNAYYGEYRFANEQRMQEAKAGFFNDFTVWKASFLDHLFGSFPRIKRGPNAGFDARQKLEYLYDSCVKDGFIDEKLASDEQKKLFRVSAVESCTVVKCSVRGQDLLHPLGFLELWLEKYSKFQVFVGTVLGSVIVYAIVEKLWSLLVG